MKKYKSHFKIVKPKSILLIFFLDLLFILLVFFVMTTSYDFQPGFSITLPSSNNSSLIAGNKLVLSIGKINNNVIFYFNNEIISWEDIETKLSNYIKQENKILPNNRSMILSLKVDKNIPYSYVIQVYDMASKFGMQINNVVQK